MKSELLLPAGNIEKMRYAYAYGADAVYLGLVDFSLRTMRKGELITRDNLKIAIDEARSLNKKVYLTLNIFAFDDDIKNLDETLEIIKDANPHAIILSDFGIFNLVRKKLPNIDIHISTQTNTTNSEAVKFWRDLGASRVILARELSLKQIETIRKNVPDIELEHFIHGSQCMSFSGRCLLSDYMTNNERKANQGGCAQPCRWSYKLLEETRPGQYFEIVQDDKGSHILSTKDLCLVHYLKDLENAGVNSFKIEGRTKSLYYVSAVAKAYREVLDNKISSDSGFEELKKVGNRGYTTGFFLGVNEPSSYSYDISKGLAGADFLCVFQDKDEIGYKVEIKNKILLNDKIEVIAPFQNEILTVVGIKNEKREDVDVANTNDIVYLKFDREVDIDYNFALARTLGIKNEY
ncbi:MAG: U32 family peptidase [Cyanobacteria bacterium SIG30]|nr:U32 family peptidase [Cyanobacteria bacterium SIG30]